MSNRDQTGPAQPTDDAHRASDAAPGLPPSGGTGADPIPRLTAWLPRLQRGLTDLAYALLLLGIVLSAGWLAARHDFYFDWTSTARNSLSAESIALLEQLPRDDGPKLGITVFAPRDHTVGRAVEQLVARYRQHRPDLDIQWVDPQRSPELAREADVELLGQILLEYGGRRETLSVLDESTLSGAIARLTMTRTPWVAVLEGHGERALDSSSGADIGRYGQLLRQRGFRLQPLDLARTGKVPDNTDLLLISTPAIELFPGEVEVLVDFVAAGGNLLWLMDPTTDPSPSGTMMGLEPLANLLGVRPLPGMVVDARASSQGFESPTFAILDDWPSQGFTRGLTRLAVLPGSLAFEVTAAPGWLMDATLTTGKDAWNETGPIRGEVSRDPDAGEEAGPLPLAMILTRPRPAQPNGPEDLADQEGPREQRVVVVGDGDFLSNAHLASAANRSLALRMARWLTGLQDLVAASDDVKDRDNFTLSPLRGWSVAVGALFIVPALFIGAGWMVLWHRGRA
jgi:hypothetical protein